MRKKAVIDHVWYDHDNGRFLTYGAGVFRVSGDMTKNYDHGDGVKDVTRISEQVGAYREKARIAGLSWWRRVLGVRWW